MTAHTEKTRKEIVKHCEALFSAGALAAGYTVKNGHVCQIREKDGDRDFIPLCDPFQVMGRTYDEDGDRTGLLIRFLADRAKQDVVEVTIQIEDLISDPKKVVAALAGKGLWVSGKKEHITKLGELFSAIRPANDLVTVNRPGWYDGNFVSPTAEVFGPSNDQLRLAESVQFKDPAKTGSLKAWKASTAAALTSANGDFHCIGLLSGFAGPIINAMEEPTSVLINFAGTTSRGKTTAQRLGASVWGNPVRGAALVKFNVTPNAIEAIAERANGTLLAIDEGGQSGMSGAQYQTVVFNLAEGSGKHRLTVTAAERKVRRRSTCMTISEEIGFADNVKRDGRNPAAGAVARSWKIDVDDAEILDDATLANIDGVAANYGHAGPVFVQHMIDHGLPDDPDLLRNRVKAAGASLMPNGGAPQTRRLAGAPAIILAAGQLAQEAGLLGADYDVFAAVNRVLQRSIDRMSKDMDPVNAALASLREGVLSRVRVDVRELDAGYGTSSRPAVGYYGYPDGPVEYTPNVRGRPDCERVYFVPVKEMLELGGGTVAAKTMARAINADGHLLKPDRKNSLWIALPDGSKISHYRVSGTFFHERSQAMAVAAE